MNNKNIVKCKCKNEIEYDAYSIETKNGKMIVWCFKCRNWHRLNRGVKVFNTIAEIKRLNALMGRHFFTPKTMRFFDSRVESCIYTGNFFITSEKKSFSNNNRKYTVRQVRSNGTIETRGEFGDYKSFGKAVAFVEELQKGL